MAKSVKSLDEILQEVNKSAAGSLTVGTEVLKEYERISFTIPGMNLMTYGGLPKGRLIEFFGKEGGGKTTTALNIMASAQREEPDKRVAFIDVEHTFDPIWATKMGVNCEELVLYDPDVEKTAGMILDICLSLMETGEFSVIVLDSVATLVSAQEMGNDIDDKTYGGVAAELTKFSKKAVTLCKKTDCIFIGINQLREEMNSQYVATRTPGGKGWKHYCSVRIEFRPGGFIGPDGAAATGQCVNPSGQFIEARLAKSKCFPPNHKIVTYTLNYLEGLDIIADTIESAINLGILRKSGAWIYWDGCHSDEKEVKWQGRVKAKAALKADEQGFNLLSSLVTEQLISM